MLQFCVWFILGTCFRPFCDYSFVHSSTFSVVSIQAVTQSMVVCFSLWVLLAVPHTNAQVTAVEWPIPSGTVFAVTAGPDGAMWFAASKALGRLNITTGLATLYSHAAANVVSFDGYVALCSALNVHKSRALWFMGQGGIRSITVDGVLSDALPVPQSATSQIAPGSDGMALECANSFCSGAIWFTGTYVSNVIGRINTTTGAATEFTIPTPNSEPIGIAAGPDGEVIPAYAFNFCRKHVVHGVRRKQNRQDQ